MLMLTNEPRQDQAPSSGPAFSELLAGHYSNGCVPSPTVNETGRAAGPAVN